MTEPTSLSLPSDHPASIQFSAWLTAFNTGDREVLSAYHSDTSFPYSAASRDIKGLAREHGLAQASGGFDVVDIESVELPSTATIVMKEKKRPIYARVTILVDDSKAGYPVEKFKINPIVTPLKFIPGDDPRRPIFEKGLRPLDSTLRRKVVNGIVKILKEDYVDQELGEKMADALNVHYEEGHYDSFETSADFAKRLTEDLLEVGDDKHMGIHFHEPHQESESDSKEEKRKHEPTIEQLDIMNFGFGPIIFDTESTPGKTIATIPINGFLPSTEETWDIWREIRTAIAGKLNSIADADALIVDLRHNHGGDPNTVAFIMSYLLDEGPRHLLDFVDRSGKVENSFSTVPIDQLPADSKVFGGKKPLFVLTTKETISGGEDMAYGLQAFERASAIVGEGNEQTAGAANPITNAQFFCEEEFGDKWWLAAIPNLKPVHEATGSNWEGIGVKSDIVAGKGEWEGVENAKDVATKLAVRILGTGKNEL